MSGILLASSNFSFAEKCFFHQVTGRVSRLLSSFSFKSRKNWKYVQKSRTWTMLRKVLTITMEKSTVCTHLGSGPTLAHLITRIGCCLAARILLTSPVIFWTVLHLPCPWPQKTSNWWTCLTIPVTSTKTASLRWRWRVGSTMDHGSLQLPPTSVPGSEPWAAASRLWCTTWPTPLKLLFCGAALPRIANTRQVKWD